MIRKNFEPGEKLGWLTLIRERVGIPKRGSTGRFWTCRCLCGASHGVSRESLLSSRVMSCRACSKAYRREERARGIGAP